MFQATLAKREDTLQLLCALNAALSPPMPNDRLLKLFERFWPDLEQAQVLKKHTRRRDQYEMLEEILQNVRAMARRIPEPTPPQSNATNLFDILQAPEPAVLATALQVKDLQRKLARARVRKLAPALAQAEEEQQQVVVQPPKPSEER